MRLFVSPSTFEFLRVEVWGGWGSGGKAPRREDIDFVKVMFKCDIGDR